MAGATAKRRRGASIKEVSQLTIAPNRKRVALARVASLEAAAEPSLALFARPVRELPLIGMTEGVVTDSVRGSERFPEILVRDLERRARGVTPDTCEAIRLELDTHRLLVRGFTRRLQPGGANQVLNVVADFVRNHVRLCEVAGRVQALFHQSVETRVDVELLIRRAIEWADAGGRVAAAAGGHAAREHDERGMSVGARRSAVAWQRPTLEERRPHVLGRSEDDAREITRRAVHLRRLADAHSARRRRCSLVTAHQSHQELLPETRRHHKERDSEQPSYDQRALHSEEAHDRGQRLDRDTSPTAATAAGAAVFEVAGLTTTFDTHAASYPIRRPGRIAWGPPGVSGASRGLVHQTL